VKEFSTKKKLRFVYQILYRTAAIYQANLRIIDKRRTEIEERVGSDTDDSDLIISMNWNPRWSTLQHRSGQMG